MATRLKGSWPKPVSKYNTNNFLIAGKLDDHEVAAYLDSNPDFLENYVLSNVSQDTLEKWTIRKARRYSNSKLCIEYKNT